MNAVPFRYMLEEIDERAGSETYELMSVSALRGVIPRSLISETGGRADDFANYKVCRPGDIVLNRMSAYQGALGRSDRIGMVSPDYAVLRPTGLSDGRYLSYVMRSAWFVGQMTSRLRGIGAPGSSAVRTPRVNVENLGDIPVPAPLPKEQGRIADFLDDRVARIDQIITARRAQAQLLRERFNTLRQAAVRGTSGDTITVGTWIGRVNSRWDVRRMGSLVQFFAGAGFPHESQGSASGDLPFAKVSDMQSADSLRTLSDAKNWISLAQARQLGAQPAPQGTIIFPKVGAALLTNNRAVLARPMAFDNNVMGVLFPTLPSRYWFHVLSVIDMGRLSNPGPVPSINREAVAELRVPFPKVDEQDTIGRTLDEAMLQVEQQVQGLGDSIRLMTEFKQSLITAAVSGELDVSTANSEIPG